MSDRELLRQKFEEFAEITEPGMPQCVTISAETVREVLRALTDTTNPKGGSCTTCRHEADENDYCRIHPRCRVCGVCSGYEP